MSSYENRKRLLDHAQAKQATSVLLLLSSETFLG
jgi:hypothetical protein